METQNDTTVERGEGAKRVKFMYVRGNAWQARGRRVMSERDGDKHAKIG